MTVVAAEWRAMGARMRVITTAAFGALLLLLIPTWVTFPATWDAERTHGYAVASFCIWQVWTIRSELVPQRDAYWLGLAASLLTGGLWLIAAVVGIRFVYQGAAVALLLAWATTVFGRAGFRHLWPLAAIFVLALPVWEVLVGVLQAMTVSVNQVLVQATRIPAQLDRNLIHLPNGTIEIAQSCAGLAFVMSALSISVIYARLFQQHWKARAVAVVTALALAIVANWIRVFGLVVIGYRSQMRSPLMSEHALYGWVIFALAMVVFFFLSTKIEAWERVLLESEPQAPAEPPQGAALLANHLEGRGVLLATLVAALPLMLFVIQNNRNFNMALPQPTPGVFVPATWRAEKVPLPEVEMATRDTTGTFWVPSLSGEQFREMQRLTPGESSALPTVQVDRFGYVGSEQGHKLVGYDNQVAPSVKIIQQGIVGPLNSDLRMVQQGIVRDRGRARLVWYWFRVADVETPQPTRAKLLELVAFVQRRTPSEMIAVSAPCAPTTCQSAIEAVHLVVAGRPLPPSPSK